MPFCDNQVIGQMQVKIILCEKMIVLINGLHAFAFCLLRECKAFLFSARMRTPVIYHQCHEAWQQREHVPILPHIYFYLLIAYQHAGDKVIGRCNRSRDERRRKQRKHEERGRGRLARKKRKKWKETSQK